MTKQVSHFPKFIFTWTYDSKNLCFMTSDIDELLKFKHKPSKEKLSFLQIGYELTYDHQAFKIKNIKIHNLTDDLITQHFGLDICTAQTGQPIPELFTIVVEMERIAWQLLF